ncbi:hypothetical protein ACKWRH_07140 [Bradyrhizobium sp. Pa8]|uniref:hypothetical protein n=1 Tax=Bradyrhizobium sp. Pa8 TaxID=3386552 RepID=UPI00403F348B
MADNILSDAARRSRMLEEVQREFSKFERKESEFRRKEREERAAELHLPLDGINVH